MISTKMYRKTGDFVNKKNIIPEIIATNKWCFGCLSSLHTIAAYFTAELSLQMFSFADISSENTCQTW